MTCTVRQSTAIHHVNPKTEPAKIFLTLPIDSSNAKPNEEPRRNNARRNQPRRENRVNYLGVGCGRDRGN